MKHVQSPTAAIKHRSVISLIIGLVLSSLAWPSAAQPINLSPTAKASVITCGPGDEFYTSFGHSAIRITDSAQGLDVVYNYGTFNFSTPHFYWKFTRGKLNYQLSRTSFDYFVEDYLEEKRAVWEQPLLLDSHEVQNLFCLLEANYLPEFRYYQYDFFRDNCATRVRDMVEAAAARPHLDYPPIPSLSYRRYIHQATGDSLQWWALGIDCLLGLPADHRASASEAMFYPLVMMDEYAHTQRDDKPLTEAPRTLLTHQRAPLHTSFPPLVVFSALFFITLALSIFRIVPHTVDRILFIIAGLIGFFLLFMWFGTDHYCTAWNLNILWASPLLLLIAIRLEHSPLWALWLQMGCFVVALIWIVACGLSVALIPMVLTLAMRISRLIASHQ